MSHSGISKNMLYYDFVHVSKYDLDGYRTPPPKPVFNMKNDLENSRRF